MRKYCVGFAFNEWCDEVLLLRKVKPAWQAGRVNGIGGHIEEGEAPLEAMKREGREETKGAWEYPGEEYLHAEWEQFAFVTGPGVELYCFRAFIDSNEWDATLIPRGSWSSGLQTEEGLLTIFDVNNLPHFMLHNLTWLIPLALDRERDGDSPHGPLKSVHAEYGS